MPPGKFLVHDDRVQAGHPPLAVGEAAQVAFAQMRAVVPVREGPAVKQRNAHGAEVFRAHQMDFHRRSFVGWRLRLTLDDKRRLPVIAAERQTRRNAHRLRTGQGAESLQQIPVKTDL